MSFSKKKKNRFSLWPNCMSDSYKFVFKQLWFYLVLSFISVLNLPNWWVGLISIFFSNICLCCYIFEFFSLLYQMSRTLFPSMFPWCAMFHEAQRQTINLCFSVHCYYYYLKVHMALSVLLLSFIQFRRVCLYKILSFYVCIFF